MSSGGNTIADIYRSVINDVINQVKESFLDENIDVDILAQLKKEWEDKVSSSGCVDLDATASAPLPRTANVVPTPMRNVPPANRMQMPQQPIRMQQPQPVMHNQMQDPHSIRSQYTIQPGQQNIGIQQGMQQNIAQLRMFPNGQQQFVVTGQNFQPGQMIMMQAPTGEHIPMSVGLNGRLIPQQQQLSHMNQMDGNGGIDEQGSSSSTKQKRTRKVIKIEGSGASEEEAMKVLEGIMKNMQMDGGGGMSDSSSDEEPEDDDDPLRRIADRIGDGGVEDGDQIAEEEPLNSEDDQSDDEDLTMLFDSDNIVMCQFEKVNRARTKWKFQLKDGIMHIDKKDYCFQKCSGEAEW